MTDDRLGAAHLHVDGGSGAPTRRSLELAADPGSPVAGILDRRTFLGRAAGLGVAAVGLPVLVGCGASSQSPTADTTSAPRRGGEMVFAWPNPPIAQMDPQLPTTGSNGDYTTLLLIYDQLTKIDPHTLKMEPGLAESWEPSHGGLVWTFRLRDAEFSNGEKVTANDVAFSLRRWANPKINSQYSFLSAIKHVQTLDPRTVRVTLNYVQGMFLAAVGHATASIVSEKIVTAEGKKYGQRPVGSGPFKFLSKVPDQTITFARNPNYWQSGKPYLDRLRLDNVEQSTAALLRVTTGQADLALVPYGLLADYRSRPGTKLQIEPYTNVQFVLLNGSQQPAYDDINIRLALNYATPRAAINKAVFHNAARLANSTIGQLEYWDPTVPVYPYDLGKARAYMQKSRFPSGFQTTLLANGSDPDSTSMATILQNSWSQIGVHTTIRLTDSTSLFSRAENFTYEAILMPDGWTSDVGPDDEIAAIIDAPSEAGGSGFTKYNDPKATALFTEASHTIDQAKRKRLFAELQRYTYLTNPVDVAIVFGSSRTLLSAKVNNLVTLPNGQYYMESVWLS